MTLNVSLTPHLEAFIVKELKEGHYLTTEELVKEALTLLEIRTRFEHIEADSTANIVRERIASLDETRLRPANGVFDRLELKARKRLADSDEDN